VHVKKRARSPITVYIHRVSKQEFIFHEVKNIFQEKGIRDGNFQITNVIQKQIPSKIRQYICCEMLILEWTHCDILDP
jgi:hypothetical protein